MIIRSKPVPATLEPFAFNQSIDKINGQKLLGKFTLHHIERNGGNGTIVIAEAIVKDIIPSSNGNEEVDVVYPCWIYIDRTETQLEFRSSFPLDKEHQYLLEDLSDEIYGKCAGSET
jgi:hypothetical protein